MLEMLREREPDHRSDAAPRGRAAVRAATVLALIGAGCIDVGSLTGSSMDDGGAPDLAAIDAPPDQTNRDLPDLATVDFASIDVAIAPTCNDGAKNDQETDVDCGGPRCGTCANGRA